MLAVRSCASFIRRQPLGVGVRALSAGRGQHFVVEDDTATVKGRCIRHLVMNSPPVNSMSAELMNEMTQHLNEAQSNSKVHGLVLRSARPGVFSAGLDLKVLAHGGPDEVAELAIAFTDATRSLLGLEKPLVSAVSGASPAGGCVMTLAADYRVMVTDLSAEDSLAALRQTQVAGERPSLPSQPRRVRIGLNEAAVGLRLPEFVIDMAAEATGSRSRASFILQSGKLWTPEEARELGLVDKVVLAQDLTPQGQVKAAAAAGSAAMADLIEGNDLSVSAGVKALSRAPLLARMDADLEEVKGRITERILDPKLQRRVQGILKALAAGK